MRSLLTSTAVVLAVLTAAPALAQPETAVDRQLTQEYGRCLQRDSSTPGMRQCASQEFTRQDRLLNAQYRQVMGALNPRQQGRLRTAQRAWIAYRDARCASLADEEWGSLSSVSASDCMVTMTAERLLDLRDYPPGGEG